MFITLTAVNRLDAAVKSLDGAIMVRSNCLILLAFDAPGTAFEAAVPHVQPFGDGGGHTIESRSNFMCSEMTTCLRCKVSCLILSRLSQSDTPASNGQLRLTLVWCKASERPRQATASAMTFGRDHGGCSSRRESLSAVGIYGDEAVGSAAEYTLYMFQEEEYFSMRHVPCTRPIIAPNRLPAGGRNAESASFAVKGASAFSF
jgi:hypothetical protein